MTKSEFKAHDWDAFHDAVFDSTRKNEPRQNLEILFEKLPDKIKNIAFEWGMTDTVFRDEVCKFLTFFKI